METPDVTLIQKLVAAGAALLTAVLTLVAVFDWFTPTAAQLGAITGAYAALGGLALTADAIIRNGRSRHAPPPDPPTKVGA
jgi:hypothetical protein